jgi:signal transduction histidine kinase
MTPMRRAPRSRLQRIADVAVPLIVALYLAAYVNDEADASTTIVLAGTLAGLAQGIALWWRRAYPVTVFLIAFAGGFVVWLIAPEGIFPIAALIAIGSLAAARPLRVSVPALAAMLSLTALNYITATAGDATFGMVFPIVAWALGEAWRSRRTAIAEESRRAVGDEQARIARELHDVIAHSVSVIVVQAAAADDVFDEHPDQARAALRSIESAGREALGELRLLLAGVQTSDEPAQPQPGLDRLDDLAEQLRASGLDVALHREGDDARVLPAGVALSAYRIVQEALTNTLRHAAASRADVTVRTDATMLVLDVLDDGSGPVGASVGSGRGIPGMRERATMLGGTLDAGPRPEGGFRVHASLPLERAR